MAGERRGRPRERPGIRAMGEHIHLMGGWTEAHTLSNGGKRWDATKLGALFATDVFETRAPGLRMGG